MEKDNDLAWKCIWPAIEKVRGKSTKREVYSSLNDGQKALFSFYSYYNHAQKDLESFRYFTKVYKDMRFIGEIGKGIKHFSNDRFSQLFEQICSIENDGELDRLYDSFINEGENHIRIMQNIVKNKLDDYEYEKSSI